jgi:hypothetical protein
MPGCQPDDREHHPEDGKLERGVVADRLGVGVMSGAT